MAADTDNCLKVAQVDRPISQKDSSKYAWVWREKQMCSEITTARAPGSAHMKTYDSLKGFCIWPHFQCVQCHVLGWLG